MTPYTLKYYYEMKVKGYYFTRSTMRFFGDTMKNYGVRSKRVNIGGVWCYELYRRKPVKGGLWNSAYFNAETFEQVKEVLL
jgi:hypothetical protein